MESEQGIAPELVLCNLWPPETLQESGRIHEMTVRVSFHRAAT